jgi:HAD superfamily hydrolase (TIGR01509 family)
MDGVIVDSEPHWNRIWREKVFPQVTGTPSLDEVTGRDYTETIPELDRKYGLDADPEALLSEFGSHGADIYAQEAGSSPELPALFGDLRDRGLAVGIVSSSPREWIRQVVDRFDLDPLSVVASAGEIDGPGKPAPDVYERAMADLGVEPETCIVIEDSESGVRAAAAAGATVIRFQQSGHPDRMPEADAIADDPSELRTVLFDLLDGA